MDLFTFFFCIQGNAQFVRRLNDEAIVSQHKRMVFESWGDWRPYGKYNFLGIQTNFAYATIWGMWAPSRNRHYKRGADLRPLKPTGLENQRLLGLKEQQNQTKKIKIEVDSLYKRNLQDFAHWTPLTVDADPLWLLYYKRMLRPLSEMKETPLNYEEWGLDNVQIYETLKSNGEIDKLQESLDLLKDKYKKSRTTAMPRGKRFLMYHETLIGWRKFISQIMAYNTKGEMYLDYKKVLDKFKGGNGYHQFRTDKEIVTEIMEKYKNKF